MSGCAIIMKLFLGVAQLVARYLGVVEAGCSSHLTQTRQGLGAVSRSRPLCFSLVTNRNKPPVKGCLP